MPERRMGNFMNIFASKYISIKTKLVFYNTIRISETEIAMELKLGV